ncbi:MAG: hypothetical protein IJP68_04465, partial [Selenomonadaceae bacterium]|nr:hypothetical protein [Selenomonadaceae bacterium]
MFKRLTRREFIKTMSLGALAMAFPVEVFAAGTPADLVVYGKIFTSENNQLAEAFAVKDGRFIYVGDKIGASAFIKRGKTEVIDYSGKGLVMPSCGNGHAHYSMHSIKTVGTIVDREDSVEKFLRPKIIGSRRLLRSKTADLFMLAIKSEPLRLLSVEKPKLSTTPAKVS